MARPASARFTRWSASAWVAALLGVASPALGREALTLQVRDCPTLDQAELSRLLALELVDSASLVLTDPPVGATQLSLECRSDDEALLQIDDRLTHKQVSRNVALAQVAGNARARVLSIAMAELLRASRLELTARPPQVVQPVARLVVAPATVENGRRFSVAIGPSAQAFARGADVFWGATLLADVELAARLPVEVGASLLRDSARVRGGRAELLLGTLQAGAGWVLLRRPFVGSVRGAARLGWLRGRGIPDDSTRTQARQLGLPWGSANLCFDGRLALKPAFVGVRLEAGYTLANAIGRVDTSNELELSGLLASASLLFGLGG